MVTADLRALAALLSAAARGEDPARLELDPPAWERVCGTVADHGLSIPLAPATAAAGAPRGAVERLEETARRERRRTALLLIELRRLLPALEEVEPVVLKGAALAHGIGHLRGFGDLDILVAPAHLEEAATRLTGLGYALEHTLRDRAFYERHHFHRVLRSPEGAILELHWDLARPSDYFRLDPRAVLARARTVEFEGVGMRIPSEADQLLHAAAQSLREGFADLRRVLDAALLLRAGTVVPEERARASGLATALWLLLCATRALTGVSAGDLSEGMRPSRWRRASLEALDPPAMLAERRAQLLPGLKNWLLLLCAPNVTESSRSFLRSTFPGERGLLDDGHRLERLPGRLHRGVLGAKRLAQTGRIVAYQAWRLALRGPLAGPGSVL